MMILFEAVAPFHLNSMMHLIYEKRNEKKKKIMQRNFTVNKEKINNYFRGEE